MSELIQRQCFTAESRSVFTLRSQPATDTGYERWFPELRRTKAKLATPRPAASTYPKRWLPDVKASQARLASGKRTAVMHG